MTPAAALRWRAAGVALWACLSLALAGLAGVALFWERGLGTFVANNVAVVGGPFALRTPDGATVTRAALLGRPHILYFGFTMCADLCPKTLYQISAAMGGLGAEADRMKAVFVTVDPERDTPEMLKRYMSAFDPRMLALTGSPAEVAAAAEAYRAYFRKVDLGGGDYTVDHTPSALLFRADGTLAGTIAADETDESARAKIAALVRSGEVGRKFVYSQAAQETEDQERFTRASYSWCGPIQNQMTRSSSRRPTARHPNPTRTETSLVEPAIALK